MKCWGLPLAIAILLLWSVSQPAIAAYGHGGADTDSPVFVNVYPDAAGTKLDSCALCHSSGQYENDRGIRIALGSCQWCHFTYGYDANGDIDQTLNPFGLDYRQAGRSVTALTGITGLDSDGDGFSNGDEIAALRFPGNAEDDPEKIPAPCRVYSREELHSWPQHTQFMLMNTHKSGDYYATYGGVPVSELLVRSGILPSATGLTAFAPDGWAQYHPLEPDLDPLLYHVYGLYPAAPYYYDAQADESLNDDGWCDYSAPACQKQTPGENIDNDNGLQMLLALTRDGENLESGVLGEDNKLEGEGPFRLVPPQKFPGPPDQSSKSNAQNVIWPFDEDADHNAGFATRTTTMIRVEPMPQGTTDIDILEAGWNYADEARIIVYGAVDPLPNVMDKLDDLARLLSTAANSNYKRWINKWLLIIKIELAKQLIHKGAYKGVVAMIEHHLIPKTDGFVSGAGPDKNDWITDDELQRKTYWSLHEIVVLMKIIA